MERTLWELSFAAKAIAASLIIPAIWYGLSRWIGEDTLTVGQFAPTALLSIASVYVHFRDTW